MKRQTTKKIDAMIEHYYKLHATGRQVNIMDIPKLFAAVRAAHATGIEIETAVRAAIEVYTVPAA